MAKGFKSALAIILTLVMLLTAIPAVSASAESALTVTVATVSGMPGTAVQVDVSIKNNPGIAAFALDVDYDKDNLTLTDFSYNTEALAGASTTPFNAAASVPCLMAINYAQNMTGDFTLATLTFQIKETAGENVSAPITLSYDEDNIYDIEENNVPCIIEDGAVNIITCIPGDINGDEKVNSKDVSRLMQYHAHWDVEVNEPALDVNGDTKLNSKDVTRLMQYLAHWDVEIYPLIPETGVKAVSAKAATCETDGNIAYWYDNATGKYYSDASCLQEITQQDTVIPATGHTPVLLPGYPATREHEGMTDGSQCSVCGKILVEQEVIPALTGNEYSITYVLHGYDTYLQSIVINNPPENPNSYGSNGVAKFEPLEVKGYKFEGWYDAPGDNGVEVKSIPAGSTGNRTLYARWSQLEYDVTYKLYQTPLKPISDEKFLHYKTSKGLTDLPNPTLYNYIFLGWYTDDGQEVKSIPAGTTGDITLNAYWTSKRNLSKKKAKLDDPIIVENEDTDVLYFAYEIGSIENVPLTDAIWTIQAVEGLSQQVSQKVTKQITQSNAESVAKTITNSTVDSGTWTLSENWNQSTSVNTTWAQQNGYEEQEIDTIAKTSSNTYSVTDSSGGSSSHTDNTGTTTLKYDSQNYTHGNSAEFDVKVYGEYSQEAGADIEIASAKSSWKVGGELGAGYKQEKSTNEHTGKDKTTLNTHVDTSSSTWNSSATASSTNTASQSRTVQKALSNIITNTKGYGETYNKGGANTETQGFSSTASDSVNSSSSVTFATTEINETTSTYSTDGKSEGCYRLVIAGTMHVYGVVGYDVASRSYFAYTFNVMDDNTYEFLDYSPTLQFNDYENGVIPFEIPYDIYKYVANETATTQGLNFRTNTSNGTATVSRYNGTDTDVVIPSYISSGGTSYKVIGISSTAFAGKTNLRAVKLGRFVEEIPDSAFNGCANLEGVYGYFTKIGNSAFEGCTKLTDFVVPATVTEIGTNAFRGVNGLIVNIMTQEQAIELAKANNPQGDNEDDSTYADRINALAFELNSERANDIANAAIASGANSVVLNLDKTYDGIEYNFNVPEMGSFTINGGKKNFKNFKLKSGALTTSLKEMNINDCSGIPLNISSDVFEMEAVNVTSPSYCLLLAKDGVTVNLKRDNTLISDSGKAIVTKNPSLVSLSDSTPGQVSTDGVLDVSGNVYLCGTMTGEENLTFLSGGFIHLTNAEFENYIKGFFTVTFDPTDGALVDSTKSKKEVLVGSEYGELPEATYDYHDLDGWYTEAEGGDKVTASTVFNGTGDVTLYAHWVDNPTSDWVLESEVPADAQLTGDEKWTYDLVTRKTSSNPTMDGYTKYNETWVWGPYGAWSNWQDAAVTKTDSRAVETRSVVSYYNTEYNYSKWSQYSNGNGKNGPWQGTWGGVACNYYFERGWGGQIGWNNSDQGFAMYGTPGVDVWYNEQTRQVPGGYKTQYRYRDRSKVWTYYFKKTEPMESSTEVVESINETAPSESITNVKKWVKYINKSNNGDGNNGSGTWGDWSAWSRSAPNPGASNSRQVESRTVTDSAAYTAYEYWRYVNDAGTRMSAWQGTDGCNTYQRIELTYPLTFNKTDGGMDLYMEYTYDGNTYLSKFWLKGSEYYHPAVTHTEWRYRDRS